VGVFAPNYSQQPPSTPPRRTTGREPNFPRGKDFLVSVCSLHSLSRNGMLFINPSTLDQLPLIKGDSLLWQKFLPWGRLFVPNLWGTRWVQQPPTTPIYPARRTTGREPNFPRGKDFFVSVCSLRSPSRNDKLWSKTPYNVAPQYCGAARSGERISPCVHFVHLVEMTVCDLNSTTPLEKGGLVVV